MNYDPVNHNFKENGKLVGMLTRSPESAYLGPVMAESSNLYRLATDILRITPDDRDGVHVLQRSAEQLINLIRKQLPSR